MVIVVVAVVLLAIVGFASPEEAFGFPGFAATFGVTLCTVGALVASRRPGNAIGWIFLASGLGAALHELAMVYGVIAYREPVPSLTGAAYAAWLTDWIWILYSGGTLIFVFLLFPHGRLPGRRWMLVAVVGVVAMILAFVGAFAVRGPLDVFPRVDNPVVLLGSGGAANALAVIGSSLFGLAGLVAVIGLAQRWRIAVGAERLQYKWLVAAGGLTGLASVLGVLDRAVGGEFGVRAPFLQELVLMLGLGAIPVAVGIAITRYGLYEIDRLISRTATYALLVGVLAMVYAGGVFVLSSLLPLEGDLAVAASTLLVAALFDPLRKRVRQRVDRRFNRPRYDAELEVERFARRLRTNLDLDELTGDLLAVVAKTVQPSTATVWIRGDRR
jgi:hypothetical protein